MRKLTITFLVLFMVISLGLSNISYAEYPEQNIQLIIPYSPGGGTDIIFRTAIPKAEELLDTTIVPVNMPGAGSTVGSRAVKDSNPDGYTLLGSHDVIATAHYAGISDYSFFAFDPVSLLTSTPNMLVTREDAPYDDANEMIEYARENPGEVIFAYSPGGTDYFYFMGLMKALDEDPDIFRQVTVEGTGEQTSNLLGGHIDVIMGNIASHDEYVKEGDFKYLGVAWEERLEEAPDTPTFKELGIDFVHSTDRGIFAPEGTPEEVVQKLDDVFNQVMQDEEVVSQIEDMGSLVNYKSTDEFIEFLENLDEFYENSLN